MQHISKLFRKQILVIPISPFSLTNQRSNQVKGQNKGSPCIISHRYKKQVPLDVFWTWRDKRAAKKTRLMDGHTMELRHDWTPKGLTLGPQECTNGFSPWPCPFGPYGNKECHAPPAGHYPAILGVWAPHAAVLKCSEKAAGRAESPFIQFCPVVMSSHKSLLTLERTGFRTGLALWVAHEGIQDLCRSSAKRLRGRDQVLVGNAGGT